MAGIYFHIPFCKQACYYCDFHFSTNSSYKQELVRALGLELELQRHYLNEPVETVYFGGGTPSLLSPAELEFLLDNTRKLFHVVPEAEVTLEANPDDLHPEYTKKIRELGVNRLSIGIQSFDETILQSLNRAHDAAAAERCLEVAREAGFSNMSIDLIYAIPGLTDDLWMDTVRKAISLEPTHISAYSLTIEEKTAFGRWAARGKITPVTDDFSASQLGMLITALEAAGFQQYEVSNFALPGYYSRHNSSYWRQLPYLGIGPSAHSYNITTRQFNISNNHLYLKSLQAEKVPATVEILTREDQINDYLLTTLRTEWGTDLEILSTKYGYEVLASNGDYITSLLSSGLAILSGSRLILTSKGRFMADKISSDLFAIGKE